MVDETSNELMQRATQAEEHGRSLLQAAEVLRATAKGERAKPEFIAGKDEAGCLAALDQALDMADSIEDELARHEAYKQAGMNFGNCVAAIPFPNHEILPPPD